MTANHEQGEKTLSLRMQRAATTVQNIGESVVTILDILPPKGAHAYRPGKFGQLRVKDIRITEPKHSKDTEDAYLSVEGIMQPPERSLEKEELLFQPLFTNHNYIPPPANRPIWAEETPKKNDKVS